MLEHPNVSKNHVGGLLILSLRDYVHRFIAFTHEKVVNHRYVNSLLEEPKFWARDHRWLHLSKKKSIMLYYKLDYQYLRTYVVCSQIKEVAFCLGLPPYMCLRPMFHVPLWNLIIQALFQIMLFLLNLLLSLLMVQITRWKLFWALHARSKKNIIWLID